MKVVVAVEPIRLVPVEGGWYNVVVPGASLAEIASLKKRVASLLESDEEDQIITLFVPGSPQVTFAKAEKVKDVVAT